jgi:hypothetical protein
MKSLIKLLFCISLLSPVLALAELPKQVELDYAVLSGYVIMPINDEYIVDLDSSDNLHVGDILTLVKRGANIYHPETKEILGSVDIPTGFLQVTRINSGYSYAKLLSSDAEPKNGAQVRRFEQVPALFVDKTAGDGAIVRQVKMDLPQFKWLQTGDSDLPLLTFTLKPDALVVNTTDGSLLHRYSVSENQQLIAKTETVRRSYVNQSAKPEPGALKKAADSLLDVFNLTEDDPFAPENIGVIRPGSAEKKGVWMGPNISGNPVGIAVADLDGDGLQETAVALDHKLLISHISQGKYSEKAEVPIPTGIKILSLDALDLDKDGSPELYLTATLRHEMVSFVVKYTGSSYEIVIDKVKWYLRAVELPGEGRVLIGQRKGSEKESFFGNPFYVHLKGNRLVKGDTIRLPGLSNMYSFVPFTDNENRLHYAYLSQGDYLKVVSAGGVELWSSGDYFGGSETCFDNRKGNDGDSVLPTCIRARLVKTPDNEILVSQNDGQRLMQRWRKYRKSRLVALTWNGHAMDESWRTASQQGYLGDFVVADADNDGANDLVMAVKFKHAGYLNKARSAVVIYAMD